MIRVGVTGGIATGKSFVCGLFELLGISIYYADQEAKNLIEADPILRKELIQQFGSQTYDEKGKYNTRYIASIVFNDPGAKQSLNEIIHPRVMTHSQNWFLSRATQGDAYAIKESALLIESKNYKQLDKVIVVDAPVDTRVARLLHRDHIQQELAVKKINSQMSQADKLQYADYTVHNDGQTAVIPQVYKIHQELIKLSQLPLL